MLLLAAQLGLPQSPEAKQPGRKKLVDGKKQNKGKKLNASQTPSPAPQPPRLQTHRLGFQRHGDVDINRADADIALTEATNIARQSTDSLYDINCLVEFLLAGPISVNPRLPEQVIDDATQKQALRAPGPAIRVVKILNYCREFNANYGACAQPGGASIAIEEEALTDGRYRGQLILHEFAHLKGVGHRAVTMPWQKNPADERAVMLDMLALNGEWLDRGECACIRKPPGEACSTP